MKTLAKLKPEKGIWLDEQPMPTLGSDDVLIKIKKTAICGTDIHIYNWDDWAQQTIPLGMTVGHEFSGEIIELGKNVTASDLKIGSRVSGEGHVVCGRCRNCRAGRRHLCRETFGVGVNRPGAFAEYLAIPANNVYLLPNDISDDIAAIFDPFGNAAHTTLSFDLVGEDVLITGAGPIGIMAAMIARHSGARHVVITDVNEYRLNLAQKVTSCHPINIRTSTIQSAMETLNMKEGFDVALEMSGNGQALSQILETMNHGGKIAMLGIPSADTKIDWNKVVFKGLLLKGIYGREMYETWYKMSSMIQSGLNLSPIITHQFDVDDFEQGFKIMNSGQSGKVIINW